MVTVLGDELRGQGVADLVLGVVLGLEVAVLTTPVGPAAGQAVEDLAGVALAAEAAKGSVAEVAFAGEDHRHALFVGGVDHFLVAHGTAGLDD